MTLDDALKMLKSTRDRFDELTATAADAKALADSAWRMATHIGVDGPCGPFEAWCVVAQHARTIAGVE